MLPSCWLLLLPAAAAAAAAAPCSRLTFHPPVLLGGGVNITLSNGTARRPPRHPTQFEP
jgi:hypothetical protein